MTKSFTSIYDRSDANHQQAESPLHKFFFLTYALLPKITDSLMPNFHRLSFLFNIALRRATSCRGFPSVTHLLSLRLAFNDDDVARYFIHFAYTYRLYSRTTRGYPRKNSFYFFRPALFLFSLSSWSNLYETALAS